MVSSNKLLDHIIGYTQVVNEPTHIFGSQIDHVYINSALFEEFQTKAIIQNIYFSDHDVVYGHAIVCPSKHKNSSIINKNSCIITYNVFGWFCVQWGGGRGSSAASRHFWGKPFSIYLYHSRTDKSEVV